MNKNCSKPSESYDWLTADNFLKNVLGIYYEACRECEPPKGEPFIDAEYGVGWSNREFFYTNLRDTITERLTALYEERVIHKCTVACADAKRAPTARAGSIG